MAPFKFPKSFTTHHKELLDICFGISSPDEAKIEPLNEGRLDYQDLDRMIHMVKVEFATSLAKEMKGPGGEDVNHALGSKMKDQEPHPYDVFLMETTLDRRNNRLAVCIPLKDDFVWFNGDTAWPLEPPTHKWRVASLSGPARVLEALHNPTDLTLMAMEATSVVSAKDKPRESLKSAETTETNKSSLFPASYSWYSPAAILSSVGRLASEHPKTDLNPAQLQEVEASISYDKLDSVTKNMNGSQSQAIRTVMDPSFQEGFFATQGPPGTGKLKQSILEDSRGTKAKTLVLKKATLISLIVNRF